MTNLENDIQATIASTHDSLVQFYAGSPTTLKELTTQSALGQGIVITSDGMLLTSRHVIAGRKLPLSAVTSDGRILPVQQVWLDPLLDLAVLRVGGV